MANFLASTRQLQSFVLEMNVVDHNSVSEVLMTEYFKATGQEITSHYATLEVISLEPRLIYAISAGHRRIS